MNNITIEDLQVELPNVDFTQPVNPEMDRRKNARTVGDHIVQFLQVTWVILKSSDVSPDFIINFSKAGLRDKKLPFSDKQLGKVVGLSSEDIDEFLEKQQEKISITFEVKEHRKLEDYELVPFIRVLRSPKRYGAYGTVEQVRENDTLYARKTIISSQTNKQELESIIKHEKDILKVLPKHPHIIQLRASYEKNRETVFILKPWADMDLDAFLEGPDKYSFWKDRCKEDKLDPAKKTRPLLILNWMTCLASALAFLHKAQIKHQDLKPKNILLVTDKDSVYPVLCDFGLSKKFLTDSRSITDAGTPYWNPPEQLQGKPLGRAGDIFALGTIYVELAGLMSGVKRKKIKNLSKSGYGRIPNKDILLALFPCGDRWDGFKTIVRPMLESDPSKRPTSLKVWDDMNKYLNEELEGSAVHCGNITVSPWSSESSLEEKRSVSSSDEDEDEDECERIW